LLLLPLLALGIAALARLPLLFRSRVRCSDVATAFAPPPQRRAPCCEGGGRSAVTRMLHLLPLGLALQDPASSMAVDSPFGSIAGLVGEGPLEMQYFSKEVFVGDGKNMVRMKLASPWPVKYDGNGNVKVGFEARKDNRCPGEVGFTQIFRDIGKQNITDLPIKQLVDNVFVDKGMLGMFTPENVKIASAKTVTPVGGSTYRQVGTRFTRVGVSGVEIESRGLLSATIVGGDLYVYIVTCRDNTWAESKTRIQPSVESFQVSEI